MFEEGLIILSPRVIDVDSKFLKKKTLYNKVKKKAHVLINSEVGLR